MAGKYKISGGHSRILGSTEEKDGVYLSDHYPICAKVTFPRKS